MSFQTSKFFSPNRIAKLHQRHLVNHLARLFSTSNGLVNTEIQEGGTVASLILNRPPVNSLSLEM